MKILLKKNKNTTKFGYWWPPDEKDWSCVFPDPLLSATTRHKQPPYKFTPLIFNIGYLWEGREICVPYSQPEQFFVGGFWWLLATVWLTFCAVGLWLIIIIAGGNKLMIFCINAIAQFLAIEQTKGCNGIRRIYHENGMQFSSQGAAKLFRLFGSIFTAELTTMTLARKCYRGLSQLPW